VLSLSRDGEILTEVDLNISPEGGTVLQQGAGVDTGAPDLVCDPTGIYIGASGNIAAWDAGGNYRWSRHIDGRAAAVVMNSELLFIGTSSGEVCAFEKSTGFIRWRDKIPSSVEFLNFPADAEGPLIGAGKFSTHLFDPSRGELLLNILTPAASGHPHMDRRGILYIGGDDWVVYSYDLPRLDLGAAAFPGEVRSDAGRSYDTGVREPSARELYTAEVMRTADRAEYLRLLDDMEDLLRSVEPGIKHHASLRSVEALCGTGVLNTITRSGYVINDFPEVRIRAASLLAQYGTLQSRDLLLQLLRYDWDKVSSQSFVESLGKLRSDPDGEVVAAVYRLLHSGRIPLGENPSAADIIIESVDRICRYSGMVRPEASRILNELYFAAVPREYRMKAIETLRAFGEKK
jgi:hypothetical protein